MNYSQKLKKLPNSVAILLIRIYRVIFSPSVGILRIIPFYPRPTCIFYPTCSQYGIDAFRTYPFLTALRKTANRVGRCHPGNEPGVDMI